MHLEPRIALQQARLSVPPMKETARGSGLYFVDEETDHGTVRLIDPTSRLKARAERQRLIVERAAAMAGGIKNMYLAEYIMTGLEKAGLRSLFWIQHREEVRQRRARHHEEQRKTRMMMADEQRAERSKKWRASYVERLNSEIQSAVARGDSEMEQHARAELARHHAKYDPNKPKKPKMTRREAALARWARERGETGPAPATNPDPLPPSSDDNAQALAVATLAIARRHPQLSDAQVMALAAYAASVL